MDSYTDHLFRKTKEVIENEANEYIGVTGVGAFSFEDYCRRTGYTRGLLRAIEILSDTEKQMRKGEE